MGENPVAHLSCDAKVDRKGSVRLAAARSLERGVCRVENTGGRISLGQKELYCVTTGELEGDRWRQVDVEKMTDALCFDAKEAPPQLKREIGGWEM